MEYVFRAGNTFVVNAKDRSTPGYYKLSPRLDHLNVVVFFGFPTRFKMRSSSLDYTGLRCVRVPTQFGQLEGTSMLRSQLDKDGPIRLICVV